MKMKDVKSFEDFKVWVKENSADETANKQFNDVVTAHLEAAGEPEIETFGLQQGVIELAGGPEQAYLLALFFVDGSQGEFFLLFNQDDKIRMTMAKPEDLTTAAAPPTRLAS